MQTNNSVQAQQQYNPESPKVWKTCLTYLGRTIEYVRSSDPLAASMAVPYLIKNVSTLTAVAAEARARGRPLPSILTLKFMTPELLHKFMTTMPPDQEAIQANNEFAVAAKNNPRSLVREIRVMDSHECVFIFPSQKYSTDATNFLGRLYSRAQAEFDKSNVGEIRYQTISTILMDPYTPSEYFLKVCVYKDESEREKVDFQALLEFSKRFASDEVYQKAADKLNAIYTAKILSSLDPR